MTYYSKDMRIVKCNVENNPPDIVDSGKLIVDVEFPGRHTLQINMSDLISQIRDSKIDIITNE